MKRKSAIFLAGIVSSLLILFFLYYNFSANAVGDKYLKNGGFNRKLLTINLSLNHEYNLKKGYYTAVGIVGGRIIIRDITNGDLLLFNPDNTRSVIKIPKFITVDNIFNVTINPYDSKVLDFQCNNDRKIFAYDLISQKVKLEYTFPMYFDKAVRASEDEFYSFIQSDEMNKLTLVLMGFDKSGKSQVVKKSNMIIDGMKEDGMLKKVDGGLLYVNFYSNRLSSLDSTLKKKQLYKTIDTITRLPLTINIRNNTITKFIEQPRTVNQITQVFKHFLFVNSYITASNDNENDSGKKSDIIDLYDINKGYKYLGTLYFTRHEDSRLQDFVVQDNKLILVYPTKSSIYEFSL